MHRGTKVKSKQGCFRWASCNDSICLYLPLVFFKNWTRPGPFLFIFVLFTQQIYQKIYYKWKKLRWCAWDLNPDRQDGRRRRIHWAMAATSNVDDSTYFREKSKRAALLRPFDLSVWMPEIIAVVLMPPLYWWFSRYNDSHLAWFCDSFFWAFCILKDDKFIPHKDKPKGRGGGQVDSAFAFDSDDPSSVGVYSFDL